VPRKQVSRRRKGRKSVQYDFAEAPESEATAEEDAEEADEDYDDADYEAPGATYARSNAGEVRVRHVSRDYTHVRNEVLRIIAIGGVLIISIIIAGFFR
jgi:hypothetical protein